MNNNQQLSTLLHKCQRLLELASSHERDVFGIEHNDMVDVLIELESRNKNRDSNVATYESLKHKIESLQCQIADRESRIASLESENTNLRSALQIVCAVKSA